MCSNYQPIKNHHNPWVKQHFSVDLPDNPWREEIYPTYASPFITLDKGMPRCDLSQFGLVPFWAADKKNFGLHTYNARTESVAEKPAFRSAWKERRFGVVLLESFFEPNWETDKAVRWRIKRADGQPIAVASIWDRIVNKETAEVIHSFSMLTINADGHEVMQHFHRPTKEKRSIVVLQDNQYHDWFNATQEEALGMLTLAPPGFLVSEPAPKT
ncbi:MAG TPA: SOS response-associated peptidase family protein [Methylotenera sp.]|nr:SOS response-associated peptidase family protein [Methylotenera sp.]